jgi:hypothetical protein
MDEREGAAKDTTKASSDEMHGWVRQGEMEEVQ